VARIYNGGTVPLVPDGLWGEGVVMPGESIERDNPEAYGWPWVVDAEADRATSRTKKPAKPAADNKPSEED
jgi:hypothetical protein